MTNSILVIDDDEIERQLVKVFLENRGYSVIQAENAEAGLKCILEEKPLCVILDNRMAGGSGLTVLHALDKQNLNPPPVIFVSSCIDDMTRRKAEVLGAQVCLEKSTMFPDTLVLEVDRCVRKYHSPLQQVSNQ